MFKRNISGAVAVADQSQKYQSRRFFSVSHIKTKKRKLPAQSLHIANVLLTRFSCNPATL